MKANNNGKYGKKGMMNVRNRTGAINIGMILLVLGLLIMVAVLGIKFTADGETDEFMGITNPEGTYGEYFMSGIAVGLVVLVIGAVLSRKKEVVEGEELDEDEELLDIEEEEEEGICPTCGAIIAVSCLECPECGEELEPPVEEDEYLDEEEDEEEEVEEDIGAGTDIECPICGAYLPADAGECPECGEPIGGKETSDEDDLFADLDDL